MVASDTRDILSRTLSECILQPQVSSLPVQERSLAELALYHGIAGRVWNCTVHLSWHDRTGMSLLYNSRMAAADYHLRSVSTMKRIRKAFDDLGVRWIIFKGPVLSEQLYRDIGERSYSDLDVLVDPRGLAGSVAALEAVGFSLMDLNWLLLRRRELGEIHLLSPDGVAVDLHWNLINRPERRRRFNLRTDNILAGAGRTRIGDVNVPVMTRADSVTHLCVHAALAGGHRLVWLSDILLSLLLMPPDESELAHAATESSATGAVSLMLDRVAHTFDVDLSRWTTALPRHAMTTVGRAFPPHWTTPERGGPSRWLARAAGAGGPSSFASLGGEAIRAARRRVVPSPGNGESLRNHVGGRQDLDEFFAKAADAER